jgi:hypothetical protein
VSVSFRFLFDPPKFGVVTSPQYSQSYEADGVLVHFSFLNDLERVTEYNYVPSDGARYYTQSWSTLHFD